MLLAQLSDLLTGRSCTVGRSDGMIQGARVEAVECMADVVNILATGHARKRFAGTAMNARSSRAHTALIVKVRYLFCSITSV